MHEIGVAQSILSIVEERAREHGEGRVTVLRLRVGQLAGVEVGALKFALEVCSKGTRAEGMAVEIEQTPARGRCRECKNSWELVPAELMCPACRSHAIELAGGRELHVDSFDME